MQLGETGGCTSDVHSVEVSSYPTNLFGLYDMGGNVWEWCEDYYDANFYSDGKADPLNTISGTYAKRVRRGGSWNYHSATLRTQELQIWKTEEIIISDLES